MVESNKKDESEEKTQPAGRGRMPSIIAALGFRNILIIGLIVVYVFVMGLAPRSDTKGLSAMFILVTLVFIMMRADMSFIKLWRDTRVTIGLTAGAIGFGVGIYGLAMNIITASIYYLIIAVIFLLLFAPLLFVKVVMAIKRMTLERVDPATEIGMITLLLALSLFLLSPNIMVSGLSLVLLFVGMAIYNKGLKREKRKADLERIGAPS